MQKRRAVRALPLAARILLGIVGVIAVIVVLFDWNWLRRPLERHLIEKSGRHVTIGHLDVSFPLLLEPTVRLRDVYVENAAWAAKRPLITARHVSFTFSIRSLWAERTIVSMLVLVDADVDIERTADGLRNWRLLRPDFRGPGTVSVRALEAHNSQLRFFNEGAKLDLHAAATDLQTRIETPGDPLESRIVFKGQYEGASFAGETLAGRVLTFRRTDRAFPVRGYMTSGRTRLDLDGTMTDVFDIGPIDAKLRLAGPTLSQVHPFLKIRPPESKPFAFEARLKQADDEYTFSGLKGRIGSTDITGEAVYDRRNERPMVRAKLRSESADLADLRPLVGMRAANAAAGSGEGDDMALPARRFHTDGLKAIDARVALDATKIRADEAPLLESLRMNASLTKGVLDVNPVELGVAGGHVSGTLTFAADRATPSARAAVEFKNLQLEKLMPKLSQKTRSTGAITGNAKLAGQGQSLAAIFGSATGTANASMARGSVSNLADAKLGLNVGKLLSVTLRGDRDIAINCGAVAFDFKNGIGKSQKIVLDTEQTHVDGSGTVDLRGSALDVLLTPQPKKPGLLTRSASIRVRGPFGKIQTSLQERAELSSEPKRAGC